jgi:flagellar protein FlgJ
MMTINAIGELASAAAAPSQKNLPKAARDFEALLLGQILRSATESPFGGGWLGTGDDDAGAQALSIAQEQFATALAANGGLGLAKMVAAAVGKQSDAQD